MKEIEVTSELVNKLVNISDTAVYVSDYETDELLFINETGKKILGITEKVYISQKCYKFLMRRDTPCQFCHKSMMSCEEFRSNLITFPLNGRKYHIRSKIIDWNGRKAHVHFINDETDLLNQQKQLRTLTDHIPAGIGIFYVYPDGRIEPNYLNDGYFEMIDSSREKREKYNGFTLLDAIYPDDAKSLQQEVMMGIHENRQIQKDIRVIKDDGSYIWLAIRADIVEKTKEKATLYCAYSDIDQLKRTKQALEESSEALNRAYQKVKASDESFHTMMEHIPGAMVIFKTRDNTLYPQYISESCVSISGFTAEETLHRNSMDPIADVHPDYKRFFINHEKDDIQSGKKISYKYQILCKDGSYRWVNLNLSPVNSTGELLYYGLLRDIDAEENAHLEKENKFYQMISSMENANDEDLIAKGRYDLTDNKILYYQRKSDSSLKLSDTTTFDFALKKMVQTAALSEQGINLYNLLKRESLIEGYKEGKNIGNYEYLRADDKEAPYWSQLKYFLYESPDDNHLIFFVYTYDINERVLENHMISKLGEAEYDVLGLIDLKTHQFESKSIKGVKSLANTKNQYIKGKFEEVIHGQIYATVQKSEQEDLIRQLNLDEIVNRLKTTDTFYIAFSAYRKDGTYTRKKMNFCYLDNNKTTIFYYCNDITELYDREQEQLRKTEEALETAKAASASKTEFFSRMSHDMRTPMNGILGMAELSLEEDNIDILKENIHKIKSSGEYLLGLINDTLDFQKIESGKLQLEPEIVNCNELLTNVIDMVKPAIEKKSIHFEVNNHNVDMNWYVNVDPIRLKQIFVNLISNAIKFTPEGGSIIADIECMKQDGKIISDRFIIRDTGIGMSKEFIENKIFKPFSQEHSEITGLYAGTGLGLSIVKKLVELMGGSIAVESELGKGTTFTILIDFEKVEHNKDIHTLADEHNERDAITKVLSGKHILLAEDHPLNAEIAKKLLTRVGCFVIWAKNGQECIDLFEKADTGQYDVILMDVRMPVKDGLTASKEIRSMKKEQATTIPIIAMTANAYDSDIKNSMEAGMNAHLAKPIDSEKLYETIMKYVSKPL